MNLIDTPDLAFIVDNLEEGILFLDKNRQIVTINKSAMKLIGQKASVNIREDIVDQLCPNLFPGAGCAKECEKSGICTLMNQDKEKERIEEITFNGLNGKIVTLRMRAIALSSTKHLARIAILLTDCSHERELEAEVKGIRARIRSVLENTGLVSSETTSL